MINQPPHRRRLRSRLLRKASQKHLFDPLSIAVLEGGFKDADNITAVMKGGKPLSMFICGEGTR